MKLNCFLLGLVELQEGDIQRSLARTAVRAPKSYHITSPCCLISVKLTTYQM